MTNKQSSGLWAMDLPGSTSQYIQFLSVRYVWPAPQVLLHAKVITGGLENIKILLASTVCDTLSPSPNFLVFSDKSSGKGVGFIAFSCFECCLEGGFFHESIFNHAVHTSCLLQCV